MADKTKVGRAVLEFEVDQSGLVTGLKTVDAQVDKTASKWSGAFKTMGAVAGGMILDRAISGIVSFGKEAFDSAGKIVDLSEKTGLSIKAVQQYGFIAEQTGSSLETWADATFKLGINVEKGGKEIESALSAIGLSIANVRQLKPEEQIDLVARKLEKVTDVQERNTIGVALMGKGYKDTAAGIADYSSLMDQATVSTDENVRALSDAGDAWDGFLNAVGATARDMLGEQVIAMSEAASGWSKFFGDIKASAEGFMLGGAPGALGAHEAYLTSLRQAPVVAKAAAEGEDARRRSLAEAREQQDENTKAVKEAERAQAAYNKEVQNLANVLTGADVARKVKLLEDAYKRLTPEQLANRQVTERLKDEILKLADAGAKLPPKFDDIARKAQSARAALDIFKLTTQDFGKAVTSLGVEIDLVDPKMRAFETMLLNAGSGAEVVIGKLKDLGTEVTLLPAPPEQPWFDFKAAALGAIDEISLGMATSITDMLIGQTSLKEGMAEIWGQIKSAVLGILDDMLAKFINEFLGGMIRGIGAANLGQRLGQALTGGGVGGGAGGLIPGVGGGGAGGGIPGGGALGQVGTTIGLFEGLFNILGTDKGLIEGMIDAWKNPYTPEQTLQEQWDDLVGYMGSDSYAAEQFRLDNPDFNPQGFAWGTPNLDYADFSPMGTPIIAHGREAMIPQGSGHQLAREIAAAMPSGFGGNVTANIYLDRDVLVRAIVPAIPDEVDRYRVTR